MGRYNNVIGYFRGQGVSQWDRGSFVKKQAYRTEGCEAIFVSQGNTQGMRVQFQQREGDKEPKLYVSWVSLGSKGRYEADPNKINQEERINNVHGNPVQIACPNCTANNNTSILIRDKIKDTWSCPAMCGFDYGNRSIKELIKEGEYKKDIAVLSTVVKNVDIKVNDWKD